MRFKVTTIASLVGLMALGAGATPAHAMFGYRSPAAAR
jgi:hypothetical protein